MILEGASWRLGPSVIRADATDAGALVIDHDERSVRMDGQLVFQRAITSMDAACRLVLDRAELTIDDVDLVVPHQANARITAALSERLGIEDARVADNIASVGNTGAAAETVAAVHDSGRRAIALRGEVGDAGAAEALFGAAERDLGPVLALVNNAGVRGDGLAIQMVDDAWDSVVDTNLSAAFRLTRRALRGMIKARFGRVVNVASVVGPRANAGQANYAAAKAGVIGMTKTVGVEVARRGVTVNAVAPGFIETDMTADLPAQLLSGVPVRRPGRPVEVAAAVRFLASDAASYITAATLFVDGGMSA